MSRNRLLLTWLLFLATFAWLAGPEVRQGPAALWPSVVAVGLAFVSRDIYLSLFLGAFSGALLLEAGNPFTAFLGLFAKHVIPALKDPWNVSVLVFTLMMGGLVELLNRGGGMRALAERLVGGAGDRRRALLGVYGLGLVVFIDGLANAMLVGKSMRPVTDRAGVSRAKLAFVVDSTSSPIAGLALVSTWVAYEMSVIKQGFENTGSIPLMVEASPFLWLVQSLPYRFYNWFLLALVFLVIWLGRDFGPMLAAERNAASTQGGTAEATSPTTRRPSIWLALVPLIVLVGGVFVGLFVQGGGLEAGLTMTGAIEAFGRADAALVFVWVTAFAAILAMVLNRVFAHAAGGPGVVDVFFDGMKQMFLPALILVFAWTLNSVLKELGTASFLVSLLGDRLPAAWLPALVFALAAVVSFSTGTSWGTMAIVMPLVIPLAVSLTGLGAGGAPSPVVAATIGAVLAGAVFGDHCSPISDTTIVSAFASDCDTMEHVRTQLPYALVAAGLAVVVGYLPAGCGMIWWLLLGCGMGATWAVVRYLGRPPRE
jgi:Na+/H+ antiporter NhaC